MAESKPQFNELILQYIQKALKEEVEINWEEYKKKMIEDIDRRKSEAIAGIVLHVMKHLEMKTLGETLTIVVRQENK